MNIRNADIHEAADLTKVGDAERYRRLFWCRPAADVDKEPHIRDLNVPRRPVAVAPAQNAAAKDRLIEARRSLDVGDGEKIRHGEPVPRGHLIAVLVDSYAAH